MKSRLQFVRDSEALVKYFLELDSRSPSSHKWVYMSPDVFNGKLKKLAASVYPQEVNRLYWRDALENLEAYDLMVTWRSAELLRSAVNSLNRGEIIPPAVLARSLIELGSVTIVEANNIYRIIDGMSKQFGTNQATSVVVSEDLEKTLLRLIHGTRIEGHPSELQQKNVLSYIDFISKRHESQWLRKLYDFLCEIAHPNVIGNARYWSNVESTDPDGSQDVKIERSSAQVSASIILENILLTLGWSSTILRNGLQLDSKSTQIISEIFLKYQNSLKVLVEATELFKRLNSQGPGELAKWCAQTKGGTGLRQGDFEPKIFGTGIMFWFKKDAKFDELKIVIKEFGLGIVQVGSSHEVTQQDWMDKVASSYGAEGVIVSIQKRSLEVANPDWKGVNDLVREIGQRVFSASMEDADTRVDNPVEPGQV